MEYLKQKKFKLSFADMRSTCQLRISLIRTAQIYLELHFLTDRLGHGMIILPTKSEVPNFTRYGNMKGVAKCKNGWFGVARGHPRWLKICAIRQSAYTSACLLAFHSNYVSILDRLWDIARYWSKSADVNLQHLYLTSIWGVIWLEFRRDFLASEN